MYILIYLIYIILNLNMINQQKSRWKCFKQERARAGEARRILIVGAGGIGCELVKNLCKLDYELTLMDYDIISQSNLNRQFCYRKTNIGQYKVDVLLTYFLQINPQLHIKVQKGNLYQYDTLYFSQFHVLISALDNQTARWYLNQMAIDHCLPMIDAGTSGYNGQSNCFIRFVTECRMCRPQPSEQISTAVCSVRGKPDRNIHCIQFSLNLYKEISGIHERLLKKNKEGDNENDRDGNGDQWLNIETILNKAEILSDKNELYNGCIKIHNKLFGQTIHNEVGQFRPIVYDQTKQQDDPKLNQNQRHYIQKIVENQQFLTRKQNSQKIYSLLFVQTLQQLLYQNELQPYDKDDMLSSLFLYASTNLRISNFKNLSHSKLTHMSYYQCKDMSGKIIPAIASTNSIAAALQFLFLSNISQKKQPNNYLSIKGYHVENKVENYRSYSPKSGCPYCSHLYNYAQIFVNMDLITWGELEMFLIQFIDDSFCQRDMRCDEYILIRNSGRKWHSNKPKPLKNAKSMIKQSRTGKETITIRYIGTQGESNWKIVLIDGKDKQKPIQLKNNIDKVQIRKNIQKQKQQIKLSTIYQADTSYVNIQDILVDEDEGDII